jgi:hypothetical protein
MVGSDDDDDRKLELLNEKYGDLNSKTFRMKDLLTKKAGTLTLACMGTWADILESRGTLAKVYTATDAFSGALEMAFDSAELLATLVTIYRINAMSANAPNVLPNLGNKARHGPRTIHPAAHISKGLGARAGALSGRARHCRTACDDSGGRT